MGAAKKMKRASVAANPPFHRTRTFAFAALGAICVYVIYQMTSPSLDNWLSESGGGPGESGVRRCPAAEYVVALADHATPDKFIILALVDTAFADMALNLYESSLRPNGIHNFLFVGAGRKACEILHNASLPCYHYVEDKDTDVASIYKSPEFIRKMNIRTEMILDALSVGFTVLHTDLDVVFLRNPLPDLKVVMLSADIATMWDSVAHNAGFVVARPTWYARSVYERMKRLTTYSRKTDDQSAMNSAIYSMNRAYKRRGFNAVRLDSKRYLCGLDYFEKGRRVFPLQDNCTDCMVVHNNWIVSREAKIYRFKEHLMWMYDKNSYYSSETQKYLVYHNPLVWPTVEVNDHEELSALRASLVLGNLLGRVVVLPRFHCSLTGGGLGGSPPRATASAASARWPANRYRRRPAQAHRVSSPAPAEPAHECPLNGLLNVTAFDAEFNEMYRENSFLRHPLVPNHVKLDRSRPLTVRSLLQMDGTSAKMDLVRDTDLLNDSLPITSSVVEAGGGAITLTAADVVRLFGGLSSRVLELQSLYKVTITFDDSEAQSSFDEKLKAAFQRCSYRQF